LYDYYRKIIERKQALMQAVESRFFILPVSNEIHKIKQQ
jgi:hypothetical protein